MNEEGIGTKIYRMNEIANVLCDRDVSKYAELGPDDVVKYRLKDRDVLFNRTNSQMFVGRTGLFRRFSKEDIVFASYLVRVTPNTKVITPEYLTAFLNTKYGVLDVQRRARISINQSNVNAKELRRVEIPLVCDMLQRAITSLFDKAFGLIQTSGELYAEARTILLSELGLTNWQPEHQSTFIKRFSDVWGAGRVDADYFQPKYEEIVRAIKGYAGGRDTLENLVNLKNKNFKPEYETLYKYIELADIGANGEITGCMVEPGRDLPSRARRLVATGDVIVSSIEGSLSSIALIEKEYNQAICSTGFHVVNSALLNSETLMVLLKSTVGQLQLKKGCSGTILSAINKDALNQVVLPVIEEATQSRIRQKVAESSALRQQSNHLLERAKQAVEIAIEQGEQAAIAWAESGIVDLEAPMSMRE